MVQQEQDKVLEDTERVAGRQALRNNVAAAVALADAVRSTLGPKGLDKLLVGGDGSSLVTNDGVTVLETAKVEHPTAKMLISTSRAQDDEVRDGTTTTVVLTAELLVNALELVDRGVHPTMIATGYRMCGPVIEKTLNEISKPTDEEASLSSVRTSLAGKGDEGMQSILAELANSAALATGSGETDHVHVLTERSGSIKDSKLVPGIVLVKARVHREMEMKPDAGRILILDGGMEKRKPEIEASLKITSLGAIDAFHARDSADLQARVDALKAANIDCLVARDGIEDEAHAMLAAAGILAYRRVERPEIEHLCRATGARPIFDLDDIDEDDVGSFASIREEKWQGVEHTIFEGSQTQGVTVVIQGSTKMRLEEAQRAFDDALGVACQLIREPQLLPGGGATQIALARRLRRHAETIPGREQMAVEGFAAALESIPRILAENAGLDSIDELLRITAAQAEKDSAWQGLDVNTGQTTDMGEASIVEPLSVTRHAIAGATEAAISVLRIDDVLWAKQDAQEPDWQTDED
ncbi:MAG: thermosome subunit alpha [Candidatus Thermoplasmatota archaeon]|nr:thermosome subunit alpha [Candidatus Thermoplasmatota archaeon]